MTSNAERQRRYRERSGATSKIGRPIEGECGTPAGYKRHLYNDERPDIACRAAWNAYHAGRRKTNRVSVERATPKTTATTKRSTKVKKRAT